jgi:anti-sigma factor RsiW
MRAHTNTWLDAYFDGELEGRKLSSAEEHLAHCATCKKELEALHGLSAFLQESPGPENLLSADQFINQVGLRMPRKPAQPRSQKVLSIGWQITPLGIIGMWSFLQALFLATSILFLAANMGFGGDVLASLVSSSQSGPSIGDLFSLQGASPGRLGPSVRLLWTIRNGDALRRAVLGSRDRGKAG